MQVQIFQKLIASIDRNQWTIEDFQALIADGAPDDVVRDYIDRLEQQRLH